MPKKPSRKSKHTSKALPDAAPDETESLPPDTRSVHGRAIPGGVYQMAMAPMLGKDADGLPNPSAYAQAVIADMAPRDAAEEMLVAQLLFAHARVMRLTTLANQQTDIESLRVVHEYADRASNTYRRLMLALAEYRRPPRAGDTFAVVKQTNIAGQQMIQNNEKPTKDTTNEQGCTPDPADARGTPTTPPSLPPNTGGLGIPSFIRPAGEAVGVRYRPTDAKGQGSIAAERNEAR